MAAELTELAIADPVGEPTPEVGAGRPVVDRSTLYSLLLRLAGRVPDDGLAVMRTCLADREESEVAFLLATAVRSGTLAFTDAEVALVRMFITMYHVGPDMADRAPRIDHLPPTPHRFAGVVPADGDGDTSPTDVPSDLPPEARDEADTAVVEAGDRVGGLVALWRVFRYSSDGVAQRVYLGEAEPTADLLELTAEMQYALTEVGEVTPRVEVFPEGAELPPYHDAALAAATLVWAARDAPVRLARVFDGAEPDGGPFFDPDHPLMEGADGERVLACLRAGELVLTMPGAMDDLFDPGRTAVVPLGFRSDGRWVWPDAVAYYLKSYRLAPEPELIEHLLASSPPTPLTRLARHRALVTLFAPTEMEPVWQAG
jgi:hypothetical protein